MNTHEEETIAVLDPAGFFQADGNDSDSTMTLERLCEYQGKDAGQNPSQALRNFLSDRSKAGSLAIVANIGNHWIAILAERNEQGSIRLKIADSLQESWNSSTASFEKAIVPFYRALTTQFTRWNEVFSTMWRQVIIDPAQQAALEAIKAQATIPFTQEDTLLDEQVIQKAKSTISKKILWLSQEQSRQLYDLVLQVSRLINLSHLKANKALSLSLSPTCGENCGKTRCKICGRCATCCEERDKHVKELADFKRIDTQKWINFIQDLILQNVHHDVPENAKMLEELKNILKNIDTFYLQLTNYQTTHRIPSDLEESIDSPRSTIDKLLYSIELSSLVLENFSIEEPAEQPLLQVVIPETQETTQLAHELSEIIKKPEDQTDLLKAVLDDNRARIIELLQKKPYDVNTLDQEGMNLLHRACLEHCSEAIGVLLENGAQTNIYSTQGLTPLHYALLKPCNDKRKQITIIDNLLLERYGTDINAQACGNYWFHLKRSDLLYYNGWTPLHFAAQLGIPELVDLLLKHKNIQVNSLSYMQESPLYLAAAAHGSPQIISSLHDHAADSSLGKSAVLIAIENGFYEAVSLLINMDRNTRTWRRFIPFGIYSISIGLQAGQKVAERIAPKYAPYAKIASTCCLAATSPSFSLNHCIGAKRPDWFYLAESLIYAKASISLIRENPLTEHFKSLKKLYEKHLNPDQRQAALQITTLLLNKVPTGKRPEILKTMIPTAVSTDSNIDLLKLLVQYKVNVTECYNAALKCTDNKKCLRYLLSEGAEAGTPSPQEQHCYILHSIHEASETGNTRQLERFLESFSPNTTDSHQTAPMHLAVYSGNLKAVEVLKNRLATLRQPNDFGLLPLHIAAINGHRHILNYILQLGPDEKALINRQNIHGLTPLHAAIMAGKVKAALLLLNEGADVNVHSERGLVPLAYAPYHQKSYEYFAPQTTINTIVTRHAKPSVLEDRPTTTIELEKMVKYFPINGLIVPSLQQIHSGDELTSYSGYYALYNALSLLPTPSPTQHAAPTKDNFDRSDRKKFTQFFEQALKEITQLRKMGSLGYLIAPEFRHLIHQLYPEAPIVVLEKAHLKAVANGIADIENIFQHDTDMINVHDKKQLIDEQARELSLLRRFSKHEIDHIILIAGVGANHGHWITIDAQRNERGNIAITVADSLHLVADWVLDRSLIVNNVLPFYLILQNGIDSCKGLFTKDMQWELFEEYEPEELEVSEKSEPGNAEQAIAPVESNKLIFVIKALQMQHESILRLKSTLQNILDILKTGRINAHGKLVMYLKIERFKRSSDILIHYLLKSRLTLNPDSPYQEKLARLERLFFMDAKNPEDVDIYATLTTILDTSIHDQKEKDNCANNLRKIITKLNNMVPMIQELEEKLSNQSDADGQEFFNAITTKLNPEHISCILKHTPPQIRGLIGSIAENKPIASSMLLYGPPGNGKTTLPQAIAQVCNRPFYIVRVASTGNSFQFSQEKDFAVINDFLKQHPNAIVLIDEIDCAFTDKKENDKAAKNLCDLIKNAKKQYPLAVIIATTNCDPLYQVDHSITRDESGNKPFPEALKSYIRLTTLKQHKE
ncbi:MAG TPA: ankyrin repeat domain-containing protein [Candidatus Dependentiae bacterium]|nr:ankyrin repeat domain-containing protein [Candidatus Dependentiae bacterium]